MLYATSAVQYEVQIFELFLDNWAHERLGRFTGEHRTPWSLVCPTTALTRGRPAKCPGRRVQREVRLPMQLCFAVYLDLFSAGV
jgi:hypothetical protein